MVKKVSFKRLILRAVLRQVSPMVIRLVSVSDRMRRRGRRTKTGRTLSFNTKIRPETYEKIRSAPFQLEKHFHFTE